MSAAAAEFHKLSETLFHWSVYEPSLKTEMCTTALKLSSGLVIIDPVPLSADAWKELLAIAPVRAVLLTNGNHVRIADELRKKFNVPLVTAPDTRHELGGIKPDVLLMENELLYGIAGIAIPGAAPGETAFFEKSGIMTVGDALLNVSPERGLEFLPDKYCTNAQENRTSLKKLLQYDFHTLTFAHGLPITDHAKDKLAALLHS